MKYILPILLFWSLSVSAQISIEDLDSAHCEGSVECHAKGDLAIKIGLVDFVDVGRGGNEIFEVNAPSVVLFGHSAAYWDEEEVTRGSVRNLVSDLRGRHLPIIYLSPNYKMDRRDEFLKEGDFDFLGVSGLGQHNLEFPETQTVLLSGGFYNMCLCNSLAHVIASIQPGKAMTVVMPMETVFMDSEMDQTAQLTKGIKEFDAPFSIRQFSKAAKSQDEFKKRMAKSVEELLFAPVAIGWGDNQGKIGMCPQQPVAHRSVDPAEFSVEIYLDDSVNKTAREKIGDFGSGSKKLRLVFASMDRATTYLKDQTGPIQARSVHFDWNGGDGAQVQHIERTVRSRRSMPPSKIIRTGSEFSTSAIRN